VLAVSESHVPATSRLGFSISGGKDRQGEPDHYIRVTDVSPGGAVARDGRIQKGDIIVKVNTVDCIDVEHHVAVEALRESGSVVRLVGSSRFREYY